MLAPMALPARALIPAALLLSFAALAGPAAAARPCTITGTPGPDRITGTPHGDVICGLGGNDQIRGGGGNDVLRGGAGRDEIAGGPGRDRLDGGPGADVLVAEGDDAVERGAGDEDTTKRLGDYVVASRLHFENMNGQSVTASQGSPSNCTRNESSGTWTVDGDADSHEFSLIVKGDGWCAVQPSHNAWKVTLPNGGSGQVEINDKGWEAPYQLRCLGGWTGPYQCVEVKGSGSTYTVTIKPKAA
jgi:Ca2+-binding RTX toxin-like protein